MRRTVALSLIAWLGAAAAADGPQQWLERMVGASGQVSFRGTLVHMCGGKVDVVEIVHRVEAGRVTERVRALDLDGREIIRNPEEVMCIMPDEQTVMVESGNAGGSHVDALLAPAPSFANIDQSNYRLQMLGRERVAGQPTEVIAIRPTDDLRYGYRLWLDRRRALPLKYELIGEDGAALEQTLFTEIEYVDDIRHAEVQPTIAMDNFVWQQGGQRRVGGATDAPRADAVAVTGWQARELPPGFALMAAESRSADGAAGMDHLVYSDGLASVSVFIEADVDEAERTPGMSAVGAMNAYTTTVGEMLITAVGDVPMRTVRMIALSVDRAGGE
jgi:sigma-E factor negative regulatory protein RseB